jgi:hypothetical protein
MPHTQIAQTMARERRAAFKVVISDVACRGRYCERVTAWLPAAFHNRKNLNAAANKADIITSPATTADSHKVSRGRANFATNERQLGLVPVGRKRGKTPFAAQPGDFWIRHLDRGNPGPSQCQPRRVGVSAITLR